MQKGSAEREELGSFLYLYLQRRFGVENMITEWGYNLYDACNRYNHDPQIGLFYGILQKEVSARSWALLAGRRTKKIGIQWIHVYCC